MSTNVCKILSRHCRGRAPFPVTLTFATPSTVHTSTDKHAPTHALLSLLLVLPVWYIFRANTTVYYSTPTRLAEDWRISFAGVKDGAPTVCWYREGKKMKTKIKITYLLAHRLGARRENHYFLHFVFMSDRLWCVHTQYATRLMYIIQLRSAHKRPRRDIRGTCVPNLMAP